MCRQVHGTSTKHHFIWNPVIHFFVETRQIFFQIAERRESIRSMLIQGD